MSWNIIEHKMSVVRSCLNDWELSSLEREFTEVTNRVPRVAGLARSIRGVLFADLAYALTRHRDWLQTSVFSALIVEFLQLDHGIPRNDAELLVHDMIEVSIQLGLARTRTICVDDREFLTWAYVCAAGANDEDSLEADLGLGTAVLNKLREGITALERVDCHVFVPEYDAMLAAIVIELGHESKLAAWAMDCHRLRFALLAAAGDRAQPYILEESLPSVLDALIAIGLGDKSALLSRPALSEILIAAGILIEDSPRGKSKKSSGHSLAEFGQRITALKAALEYFDSGIDSRFFSISASWQAAVVRRGRGVSFESLESLVTDGINRISPAVLEAVIARMLDLNPSGLNGALVRGMLRSAQMGWHKAAVLRALRAGRPSRDLLDAVASELSDSVTPGVKLAAGALLDAWTE